jgi:hypothetical protein
LIGLEELCSEFGFSEFSSQFPKLSQFFGFSETSQRRQIASQLLEMRKAFLRESFEFIVNGSELSRDVCKSAALCAILRKQLSVDSCPRKFFLNSSGIDPVAIDSPELLHSGEMISYFGSALMLSKFIGNEHLERLFLDFSKLDIEKNLSELMIKSPLELDFGSTDISNFSFEVLDNLLLNESISVESEDSLLPHILKPGPDYRDLVRHIQIANLSANGLSLLSESFDIPFESVLHCAVERITHPHGLFDSQIISDIPAISGEFEKKRFSLVWSGSRHAFRGKECHDRGHGQTNSVTVILNIKEAVFGGCTPVEWGRRVWNEKWGKNGNRLKADDSLKSFVFTLMNLHDISESSFALKSELKHHAIFYSPEYGRSFSYIPSDIYVFDHCNANTDCGASFGSLTPTTPDSIMRSFVPVC